MKAAAASGKAIIYVHHGRVFDAPSFWAELIEALAPTEAHVAASVGRMDRGLGVVPSHWFVRGHVPQASVLAHASLMVASATSTAVLGALTAGVPSCTRARGRGAAGSGRVVRPGGGGAGNPGSRSDVGTIE